MHMLSSCRLIYLLIPSSLKDSSCLLAGFSSGPRRGVFKCKFWGFPGSGRASHSTIICCHTNLCPVPWELSATHWRLKDCGWHLHVTRLKALHQWAPILVGITVYHADTCRSRHHERALIPAPVCSVTCYTCASGLWT